MILRQSVADFVKDGQTFDEIALMARRAERRGTRRTDIGWHGAVPHHLRAAWRFRGTDACRRVSIR